MNQIEKTVAALREAAELYAELPDLLKTRNTNGLYYVSGKTLKNEAQRISDKYESMKNIVSEFEENNSIKLPDSPFGVSKDQIWVSRSGNMVTIRDVYQQGAVWFVELQPEEHLGAYRLSAFLDQYTLYSR